MKKLLTIITLSLALIFTLTLPILASDSDINVKNFPAVKTTYINKTKVSKVTLNTRKETINVGSTTTLISTVYPDTATNKNVTWKSSNTSVATVDANGIVEAKKSGTSIITVSTEDGKKKANCKITVPIIKVTGVTLNESTSNIKVGNYEILTATIAPTNATNKNVTWKSSNKSVATVDSNGKVVGVKAGTAIITVTTVDKKKIDICKVTVESNPVVNVTGVRLNKSTTSIDIGANETLIATITPTSATNKNVTWSSSDTTVATVDSNGKVIGAKAGTARITATTEDGHKKATCNVTVNQAQTLGTISSASIADDGTITVTLNRPDLVSTGGNYPYDFPGITDFAITASGKAVNPTAMIFAIYEMVILTIPPTIDQSVVYSVSYKGGEPVVANIQPSNTVANNIKVGQCFNVPLGEYGTIAPFPGMNWTFTTNNDAIKLIQTTSVSPVPLVGGGILKIWTFQATQTGSFNLHFSRETPPGYYLKQPEILDFIINVAQS